MIWSLVLIATVVVCQANARGCPKDMPYQVQLRFSTGSEVMDLAVTPSVDDAFNALAGSSEPLTSEEKFTLSLQVQEGMKPQTFSLKNLCFNVEGAKEIIGYFRDTKGNVIDKQKKYPADSTEWSKVCYNSGSNNIARIELIFKQNGASEMKVKQFKADTCHEEIPK